MNPLVVNLIGMGVLLPLATSVVVAGVLRLFLGRSNGPLLAAAAISAAVAATYWVLFGCPPFPPPAAGQKVAYLTLFGLILGFVLDLRRDDGRAARLMAVVWPAVIVLWMGWRQISALSMPAVLTAIILWAAGIYVLLLLLRQRNGNASPVVSLLVASVGGAMIALFGASGSVGQMYGVLAAATGGFLLWNWPKPRFAFGALGGVAAGGVLMALAVQTVMFTEASKIAMFILLGVFLAPLAGPRVRIAERPGVGTILLGLIAAVPAAAAVIAAFLITGKGFESPI